MSVIVAVDRENTNGRPLEEGNRLAEALGEELIVVHAMSQKAFQNLEQSSVKNTGQPVEMDRVREIAAEASKEAIEKADVDATTVGLVGDPKNAVVRYAESRNTSYLVIGGRKRSAVQKAIFGSVAQSILLNSDCPVVTVLRE